MGVWALGIFYKRLDSSRTRGGYIYKATTQEED